MRCLTYCFSDSVDLAPLEKILKEEKKFKTQRFNRALEIYDPEKKSYCYVFTNGTLVSWNLAKYQLTQYFQWIANCMARPFNTLLCESYTYRYGETTSIHPHDFFNIECLVLERDMNDSELKLSLSYGLSQSIKLKHYENLVDSLSEKYSPLIRKISQSGLLNLPLKKIRQIIGEIIVVKSEINLISDCLYQPKFFWQHPNLEHYFVLLQRYLDMTKRTDTLNQKLNTLNEIFSLCNSYIENKHSHRLEIIIVLLIALELIFGILNLHL